MKAEKRECLLQIDCIHKKRETIITASLCFRVVMSLFIPDESLRWGMLLHKNRIPHIRQD